MSAWFEHHRRHVVQRLPRPWGLSPRPVLQHFRWSEIITYDVSHLPERRPGEAVVLNPRRRGLPASNWVPLQPDRGMIPKGR